MGKTYRVRTIALRKGAKHEMEHTDSMKTARRIARDHLREHPSYYDVLPLAEKIMASREKGISPLHKKRHHSYF